MMEMSHDFYLSAILEMARHHSASDVHLIAGIPPAFRISGEIIIAPTCEVVTRETLKKLTSDILTPEQMERLILERELSISHTDEGTGRVRITLYHRSGCPEMAIRLCSLAVRSREELMLPEIVDQLAERISGLIIVTGPTGVGKTTTLHYMIDLINASRRGKIVTIEDPLEYEHSHRKSIVTQIEVGTDTRDFASCLKNVLRLDPDVICIGEMRDMETIETALAAADTGHLVLATLHTPGAVGTVERIVNAFQGDRQQSVLIQLACSLEGVIAQRLIPTVDKKSRILATEILLANEAVRNMIRDGKVHLLASCIETGRGKGMYTMEDCLARFYRQGLITLERALSNANDPGELKRMLGEDQGGSSASKSSPPRPPLRR